MLCSNFRRISQKLWELWHKMVLEHPWPLRCHEGVALWPWKFSYPLRGTHTHIWDSQIISFWIRIMVLDWGAPCEKKGTPCTYYKVYSNLLNKRPGSFINFWRKSPKDRSYLIGVVYWNLCKAPHGLHFYAIGFYLIITIGVVYSLEVVYFFDENRVEGLLFPEGLLFERWE